MDDCWYIAQLKPNSFDVARRNLSRQGFESFMPMRLQRVRHARKVKDVPRPLYEGYLFVHLGHRRRIGGPLTRRRGWRGSSGLRLVAPQLCPRL